jgi:hypothetical protein
MIDTTKTESGASAESKTMIYEFKKVGWWPGSWYGAKSGELGDKIRKYKPVQIVRIR